MSDDLHMRAPRRGRAGWILCLALLLHGAGVRAAPLAYVTNFNSSYLSAVDVANDSVTNIIVRVGQAPSECAASRDGARLYVANYQSNTLTVVSTATQSALATVPLPGRPRGVAVSPDGSRAYVTSTDAYGDTLSVIDTTSAMIIATIPVWPIPEQVAVSPDGSRVYVSHLGTVLNDPDGAVSVIDAATNALTRRIRVPMAGSTGVVLSHDGARLYMTDTLSRLHLVDTANGSILKTVQLPPGPGPVAEGLSLDGSRLYVLNTACCSTIGSLVVLDATSLSTLATVPVGKAPSAVHMTPDGTRIYVLNYQDSTLSVLNAATNTVAATIPVGYGPMRLCIAPTAGPLHLDCASANPTQISCSAAGGVVVFTRPAAANATVTCDHGSGETFPFGRTTVSCIATNGLGQSSSCTFPITVADSAGPVISCPAVAAEYPTPADDVLCAAGVDLPAATAADACSGVQAVTDPPTQSYGRGDTQVTYRATDRQGNAASCDVTVSVVDRTGPSFGDSCLPSQAVATDPGACSATLGFEPKARDNCDGDRPVLCEHAPSQGKITFARGTTTERCVATDAAAPPNEGTCGFTVTVEDHERPTLILPGDSVVVGTCGGAASWTEPAASDNCTDRPVTVACKEGTSEVNAGDLLVRPGDALGFGEHTITCTATDGSGNKATGSFRLRILEPLRLAYRPPIDADHRVVNLFRVGQTIPNKVEVRDCQGGVVSGGISVTLRVTLRDEGQPGTVTAELPEDANGVGYGNGEMLSLGGLWHYNLVTSGCVPGTSQCWVSGTAASADARYYSAQVSARYLDPDPAASMTEVGSVSATLESR